MKSRPLKYDISNDVDDALMRLGDHAIAFHRKAILITGGTGFFGRWILQILCTLVSKKNLQITLYVVSRNPEKFLFDNSEFPFIEFIQFIKGDLRNFCMPNVKIDYLIHMATTSAEETFAGEDYLKKIELLYLGTKNTLENSIKSDVEKVLFTSSGVAYGPLNNGTKFIESDLCAPKTTDVSSALGEGKRIAEYLLAYYADKANFKYSIARCFSFAGQYLPLDVHYAFGNFIYDAMNKKSIIIKGSGEEIRSYLYIGDASVWLLKSLIKCNNQIYNVGSSHSVSIFDLAEKINTVTGLNKRIVILKKLELSHNFMRDIYVPNNQKICSELSVKEWTSLDEIITKMTC